MSSKDIPEIILEYTGHPTFSTIGNLLVDLKSKIGEKGIGMPAYKRIISIMIESLENIYKYVGRYQDYPDISENYPPKFSLSRLAGNYFIEAGNPIKSSDAGRLKEKLEMMNSRNHEELRALYLHTISDGQFTPKGGAGLGLIEMAKIAAEPLEYLFEPIDDRFYWYSLRVVL